MPCPFSSCCCTSKICFTGYGQCPATHPLAGISVVLKDPGGTQVGATQTTDSLGTKLCWDIGTGTGTYSVVATWTNGVAQTIPVNVTTCAEYDTSASWLDKTCVTVTGCSGTITDATVTICGNNAAYDAGSGSYCFTWSSVAPPTTACDFVVTLATGPTRTVSQIPGCTASFSFIDKVCVTVEGCTDVLAGASVTITDGGTAVGSGTTDSSGQFCCTPTTDISGHTLTLVISKTRFNTSTTSPAAACTLATITLSPATGYFCCGCNEPLKSVLTLTDAQGTWTSHNGGCTSSPGMFASWAICYQTPTAVPNAYHNDFSGCGAATAKTEVGYVIQFTPDGSGSGTWTLTEQWGEQSCTGTDHYYATTNIACSASGQVTPSGGTLLDSAQITLTGDCSVPTSLSGTMSATGTYMSPPVTGGITITE